MKNLLRWICVLPAAVGAYVLVQIVWIFMPMPNILVQIGSSWGCPAGFIIAGIAVAPSHKSAVALALSLMLTAGGGFLIYLSIKGRLSSPPLWALIAAGLVPLMFVVF